MSLNYTVASTTVSWLHITKSLWIFKKVGNFYLRSGGLFVFTSSGSVMAENSGGTVNEGTNGLPSFEHFF